jgi:hypothetical protein
MPLPTIPSQGNTSWYSYAQALHDAVNQNETDILSLSSDLSTMALMIKVGNNFVGKCITHGVISTNTNGGTVLQDLIDHCSNFDGSTGHKGGKIELNVDQILLTSPIVTRPVTTAATDTSTTVWPLYIKGQGVLPRPGGTTGAVGGTVLKWNSGTAPSGTYQAVLDANDDCHGYIFEDFTIDGNSVAACCAVAAGRKATWHRVQFRNQKPAGFGGGGLTPTRTNAVGLGLYITNGNDTQGDRYVQQRVINCEFIGPDRGIGLMIEDSRGGSGCTDGRIEDIQCYACNDGGVYIGTGGWGVRGGQLEMSDVASGTRNWNLWLKNGFLHVGSVDVGVTPLGPNIWADNNNFSIVNCKVKSDGKNINNTYPAIRLGGAKGTVAGCIWYGNTNTFSHFIERTNTQSVIVGNTGPSDRIGTAIISNASTNTGFNLSYTP